MISCLIPTIDNPWHLDTQIATLWHNSTTKDIEILVYSNWHKPSTSLVVNTQAAHGVPVRMVHSTEENHGVAAPVNKLLEVANGDFIFYIGDDTYALNGWDQAVLDRVTPGTWQYFTMKLIEPTGKNPVMYAPHNFGRGRADFQEEKLIEFWNELPKRDCISISGPAFAARWIWETVEGFDERYFPGFATDPDFSTKIWAAAKMKNKTASFLSVGDSGFYHFQCIGSSKVSKPDADGVYPGEKALKQYKEKWGFTNVDFKAIVGHGTQL